MPKVAGHVAACRWLVCDFELLTGACLASGRVPQHPGRSWCECAEAGPVIQQSGHAGCGTCCTLMRDTQLGQWAFPTGERYSSLACQPVCMCCSCCCAAAASSAAGVFQVLELDQCTYISYMIVAPCLIFVGKHGFPLCERNRGAGASACCWRLVQSVECCRAVDSCCCWLVMLLRAQQLAIAVTHTHA